MSSKNLGVMLGAMMLVRSIDQEDPTVLMKTRVGFGVYLLVTTVIYGVVHWRIMARNDRMKIKVPVPKPPFGPGSEDPPEEREMTVLEYDIETLRTARQGWIFNTLLLTAIHYKMQTVSPLIMSGLMTFVRLVSDDQLVKLHIMGAPAVGALKRPFKAEENPLATMLKGMIPKPEDAHNRTEDLHDDGDDTDEDDGPRNITDVPSDDDDDDDEFDNDETSGKADKKDK